jgi:hypothetical protein
MLPAGVNVIADQLAYISHRYDAHWLAVVIHNPKPMHLLLDETINHIGKHVRRACRDRI